MEKKQTYSDLITMQEVKTWKKGEIQLLNGGTGTGKTYFIINTLAKKLKKGKILFLCNRSKLMNDVIADTKKYGTNNVVTVMTYQALQNKLVRDKEIEKYDVIACDEAHYLTNDSGFVEFTDVAFDFIMKSNTRIIFMSATIDTLKRNIKDKIQNTYKIDINYSYVSRLELMYNKSNIEERILQLLQDTEDKIIYFANSAKEAYRVYLTIGEENAHFYCSKGNKDYNKYSDYDCIQNETFSKRVLVTTKVLDNGVNLVDRSIKHILTDILDPDTMQQCLGRKRVIDENDTCNFYIRLYSKKELGNFKGGVNKELKPALLFKSDKQKFMEEYIKARKPYGDILFNDWENDGKIIINEMKLAKYVEDYVNIALMENYTHKNILLTRLGSTIKQEIIVDTKLEGEYKVKSELELYLDSIVDKRLHKEEQLELIEKINLRADGKQQKSVSILNAYLIENFNKQLISKRVKEQGKLVTVWELSNK